jgi:xanthine phosphoribosyltransferase
MRSLIDRIKTEGQVVSEGVLKVDSFLNHQIDPKLTVEMGKAFASYFGKRNITKVLTLESSGIPPALTTAIELEVPMIFAKKQKPMTMKEDVWVEKVFSFTKQIENEIHIGKSFISPNDCVLIIDDFLAHGEAALGLASIVKQAGAEVAGIGIVIEKAFQEGGKKLRDAGFDVLSLARIKNLSNQQVEFLDEE